MLDVHPAHHAAQTWREFLIHIATIVLGLLIAIGLEQGVEMVHHRHQLKEMRDALGVEHEQNRAAYADNVTKFRLQAAAMQNNLIVLRYLQQHPGTPQEKLPGIFVWHALKSDYTESAWKTAQQSNITGLMNQDEVRKYERIYGRIERADDAFDGVWAAIVRARLINMTDPDTARWTQAQIAQEIGYTEAVLEQTFVEAAPLVKLSRTDPSFTPVLTREEVNTMMHVRQIEEDPSMLPAIVLTNSRLPADSQLALPAAK